MRRLLAAALATTAALAIAAPGAAIATASRTPTVPTVLTFTGPHMYNPATGKPFPQASTVTVSQNTQLVNQSVRVSWTWFTPSNPTTYNDLTTQYPVMVAECNSAHPTNPDQCFDATNGGAPPTEGKYGPGNTSYAVTQANGTGTATIVVLTQVENQFLGCGPKHGCSLVVVPAQGGNILVSPPNCGDHSVDAASDVATYAFSVLPNSACSWAKRIVIPLQFASTADNCPLRNADFTADGSPMLARAMAQWQPGICTGSNSLAIQYNSSDNEFVARNLFASGATDVAFTTQPFASGTTTTHPYTYAPVAVSATSVAYWVDDSATGQPYTGMRLNARLLAKLLTTSYAFTNDACPGASHTPNGCDNSVDGNPISLFADPEFQHLNSTITNAPIGQGYQIPTIESGTSDMTWTVTGWIGADKDATSFLGGTFDPWGMHVNTSYLGAKYPTQEFTTQDPYVPVALQYSPTFPLSKIAYYQSLNWQPGLQDVKDPVTGSYIPLLPEPVGDRALFAIMEQASASAFLFPVAALENHAGKFVEPTMASMAAAVKGMTVNPDGITRSVNFNSTDPAQYPLTMVIYAIVPTGGIPHAKAVKIARFLDYVAAAGQKPGTHPGELAPGYLPLTAALRQQTLKAAQEVLNQVGNKGQQHHQGGGPSSSPTPSASQTSTPAPSSTGSSPQTAHEIAVSFSRPDTTGMSWVVLALLIAGFAFAISGPATLVYANPRARAAIQRIARTRIPRRRRQS